MPACKETSIQQTDDNIFNSKQLTHDAYTCPVQVSDRHFAVAKLNLELRQVFLHTMKENIPGYLEMSSLPVCAST